jgi:Tol biopolymer transport system component
MLPSLSASGRLAAFRSLASSLVDGDTNNHADIFVRDLDAGLTTRVSIASSGNQANGDSISAVISADGRYVAFISEASNLVSGDTNGFRDVFVHDRQTGVTERVSVSSAGAQANDTTNTLLGISADGRQVAFASWADNLVAEDTNGYFDVFVHDRWSGVTEIVSVNNALQVGDRESYHPAISSDGRFIAFDSYATNLVSGDTNNAFDVFVRDREAQPQPSLTSDYTSGTPASFFNVQGANFPRNSLATISANGLVLTSTLPVDSNGFFSFTLDTTAADPGYYAINAATNPQAFAFITLDPAYETHPLTGTAALLSVPGGVAFPYWSYLAILHK